MNKVESKSNIKKGSIMHSGIQAIRQALRKDLFEIFLTEHLGEDPNDGRVDTRFIAQILFYRRVPHPETFLKRLQDIYGNSVSIDTKVFIDFPLPVLMRALSLIETFDTKYPETSAPYTCS